MGVLPVQSLPKLVRGSRLLIDLVPLEDRSDRRDRLARPGTERALAARTELDRSVRAGHGRCLDYSLYDIYYSPLYDLTARVCAWLPARTVEVSEASVESTSNWEGRFEDFLMSRSIAGDTDPAHDLAHVRRVVATAKALAGKEQARPDVVVPAAWLHDCVIVPKDSPLRPRASVLAAGVARDFLRSIAYPGELVPQVEHAIAAHSFSAGVQPLSIEACVVQDADRLDALGAIGLARCLMLGATMNRPLYHEREPIPRGRVPDDNRFVVDHLFTKLFRLEETMTTPSGRALARARTEFLHRFVEQLERDIAAPG
jgi:uncharacterized protein